MRPDKGHLSFYKSFTYVPLYTERPKREWVGLTREEKAHILDHSTTVASAVKAIESKLREKNT